jgi:polyisoprenoid-binding protein YceI
MTSNPTTLALAVATALLALPAHAAEYMIEPSHTFVTFEIDHFATTTNRARFDKKEGTVAFDRAAKTGKVELTVDVASVNSGTAQFDKHLKSDEILKAEKFPTAKFVGDKFTFEGDKVTEVAGTLTLAGKTNPVVLKARRFNCYNSPMLKREVCGGDFDATIQRSQWGVDYGMKFGMPDTMRLVVQVEAVAQQ